MLRRGLAKRCPLCGSGGLFTGWFRMKERCPGCGYLFEREEGFFLGAYVVNLAIAEGLVILLAVVPTIVLLARNPDTDVVPILIAGLVGAIVAPMAFYPFSKTIWTAVDLIMRPRSVYEPTDRR
jgi:Mn2+/Fe2+ NRAMP family transporter